MSETFDRDIDADQRVCEAAPPGPWSWEDGPPTLYSGRTGGWHGLNLLGRLPAQGGEGRAALDFACAAREGWPAYIDEVRRLRGVIEQHGLCHDLHGRVGAEDFAAGCEAEQRRIYGQAPHADEIARLRAEVASLKIRLTRALEWLEAANDQH